MTKNTKQYQQKTLYQLKEMNGDDGEKKKINLINTKSKNKMILFSTSRSFWIIVKLCHLLSGKRTPMEIIPNTKRKRKKKKKKNSDKS